MLSKLFKTALVAVIGVSFLAVGGCGKADSNSIRVGPVGPTSPSGYYFTLEANPAVVQALGTVNIGVRVTDAANVPINGTVTVVTVHLAGSTTSGSDVKIDAIGRASAFLVMTGTGGRTVYITATVEDKNLTVPIQILP